MKVLSVFPAFPAIVMLMLSLVAKADEPTDVPWTDRAVDRVLAAYDRESVLIVGELHGTEETPVLVGELTQRLARDARIVLGLEISSQEQRRIDDFLRSDGGVGALNDLLSGDFWQVEADHSDGRRSQAIVRLLESIRMARLSGSAVSVVALDGEELSDMGGDRRQSMATRIVELYESADYDVVVVLLGNYHARLTPPSRVTSDGEVLTEPPVPTAARIAGVPITTMNVTACSGGFWACISQGSCGPIELPGQCDVGEFPVVDELDTNVHAYHIGVTLEMLTPSPPAR